MLLNTAQNKIMALKIKQLNKSAPPLRGNGNKSSSIFSTGKLADILGKMASENLFAVSLLDRKKQ